MRRPASTALVLLFALLALAGAAQGAPLPEDQYGPAVAFDGTGFFVVWQDYRPGGSSDVYGARVSTAGVVLDPNGIAISTAPRDQRHPAVAFDGTSFLVVWEDERSPASGPDVYGARVTPAGVVLDPGGIPLASGASAERTPAVGRLGLGSLVVWADAAPGAGVSGARVTTGGASLGPIAISAAPGDQLEPALAHDGANALVVWVDHRAGAGGDVYGTRVDSTGTVLDAGGVPLAAGAADEASPAVAFDGVNFVVAWEGGASGASPDVHAVRVSPAGAVLAPGSLAVSTDPAEQSRPALAFDGFAFLLAWQDDRGGTVFDVYGVRVSTALQLLAPPVAVSTAAGRQGGVALAFGVAEYLLAWEDGRAGGGASNIVGARLTRAGVLLDPAGIPIPGARDLSPPRTRITAGPSGRETSRTATFRFGASEAGSTFRCKLDGRRWRDCRSPATYRGLTRARHTFRVRARDRAWNVDPTPAKRTWRIAEPVPGLLRVVPGRSRRSGHGRLLRYTVEIEDGIELDRLEVAETVHEILADRRSWGGTGRYAFQRVSSGPVSFRVTLATPGTVDRLCRPLRTGGIYSCGMRGRAALNLMRWRRGAPAFAGNMTKYRRYLVNHEVGHLLGHGHRFCPRAGTRAPVMMQQTKGVGACRANGWPLSWERG